MTDVLVVGAGAAGLSLALQLADRYSVTIISKKAINQNATYLAQGGIAAVQTEPDSFASHIADTLIAGAGLCDKNVVEMVINRAPEAIEKLVHLGVDFTRGGEESFDLTREGGHSHNRIFHVLDQTGKAVSTTLAQRVVEHNNIQVRTHCLAIDLVCSHNQCQGIYIYDMASAKVETISCKVCVLATGGASQAYLYSTNSEGASGDGIAMAWRAGCAVANLEFNQFHPTCLYHAHSASFLLSEALRGEGAKLILPDGSRFMESFDKRAELAPRDIVARAIDFQMKRLGVDCLYLDIRHKSEKAIRSRFPAIYKHCMSLGIDICNQPIPVVPASHYTCGGVLTDSQGKTNVDNLFCIGESACTNLHGANRLASNSLLECLVFAERAADHIATVIGDISLSSLPEWDDSLVTDSKEDVLITHNWDELRRCMWNYVGIVRSDERLHRAAHRIRFLTEEIHDYYKRHSVHSHLIELRNLLLVSDLIVTSAQQRKESRGLHYTLDYPQTNQEARNTLLRPSG